MVNKSLKNHRNMKHMHALVRERREVGYIGFGEAIQNCSTYIKHWGKEVEVKYIDFGEVIQNGLDDF